MYPLYDIVCHYQINVKCIAERNLHLHLRALEKDIQYYSILLRQGGGLVEEPCQLIRLRGFSTHNSEGPCVFAQVQIVLLPGAMLHRDSICKDNGEKRRGAKRSD